MDADIYNFDETGFMMGVISTAMGVTSSERSGRAKAKQPGNREWVIQAVNALGWSLPPFVVVKGTYISYYLGTMNSNCQSIGDSLSVIMGGLQMRLAWIGLSTSNYTHSLEK